jgi:hypothetical protein
MIRLDVNNVVKTVLHVERKKKQLRTAFYSGDNASIGVRRFSNYRRRIRRAKV